MIKQLVRVAPTKEREAAIATLKEAFRDDPVVRWVWPDDKRFEEYWAPFVDAFAGAAFDHGSAHATEDVGGVGLWLPPGVASDGETLGALAAGSIDEERQDEVFTFLGIQDEVHPHEPHWYLPLIGVGPASQGQGYGSALLEYALAIVDRDGLPAYLEATTPRNRALYERHGFEVVGEIQHASSPPMWPMRRKAR
jgi:ribosomal protein S18 acetylase RimI-like enzyme